MQAFIEIDTLKIISTTRKTWSFRGEYITEGFVCIEFECPPDKQLANVVSLGEPEDIEVQGILGKIHRNPTVELEDIPEIEDEDI